MSKDKNLNRKKSSQKNVVNSQLPKIEIINFNDNNLLLNDIIDYNNYVQEMENKLEIKGENMLKTDENFYENIYNSIKGKNQKINLKKIESLISKISKDQNCNNNSFWSDKKSGYIYTDGKTLTSLGDVSRDFSNSKIVLKNANMKIIRKNKNNFECINDTHKYNHIITKNELKNEFLINLLQENEEMKEKVMKDENKNNNLNFNNLYDKLFLKKYNTSDNVDVNLFE